jgi:hypothetical protein
MWPQRLPLLQLPSQPRVALAGADVPGPAGLGRVGVSPRGFLEAPKRLRHPLATHGTRA